MSDNNNVTVTSLFVLLMFGSSVMAQDVRLEKQISLSLASEAAAAAMQVCKEKGFAVSATVVDKAGHVKAVVRADGAGPHTLDASRRKAFTSASVRSNTSVMLENVQKNPGAAYLPLIDGFLIVGGGMPIRVGDEVIGAIGVGGAPGGHLDDQCAEAGINKIRDRLK